MAVRVRVRIARNGKEIVASALANSGYESETPQVLLPIEAAEILSLWPPEKNLEETVFDTAGGPLRVWVASRVVKVKVVVEDIDMSFVEADAVISPIADEILLSDKMISELNIALEDPGRGYWRFTWEGKEVKRRSEPPRYWK
ncbi:MAG: hypothetical protein RQ855_03400 [Desulfurococcales archaeon]|nr:hypothetical protein [Desulfurococcales archaeon]